MADEQQRVSKKLNSKFGAANALRIKRGTIVSVGASTATVTMSGSDIPGVPFYSHVTGLTAGDNVDIHMDGETPVIAGKLA